jgi:hypothetical protein
MSFAIRTFNEKYFEILEDYFGVHYQQMKRKRQTPVDAASESLSTYSVELAKSVLDSLEEEMARLDWEGVEDCIKRQGGVKAFIEAPAQFLISTKPVQRLALYADTVILSQPEPIYEESINQFSLESRMFAKMADSLGLLQSKELFLADVTRPIATIARPAHTRPEARENVKGLTNGDALALFSELFGTRFSSIQEIREFVRNLGTLDTLCGAMKKPELLHGTDRSGKKTYSLKSDIELTMNVRYSSSPNLFAGVNDPDLLVAGVETIAGGLAIANSQLLSCGLLGAHPCADHDENWRYLVWKFEHDSELLAKGFGLTGVTKDLLVLNALQLDEFNWLGNAPIDAIVRLREEGELRNIRDILTKGIERIESVSDDAFVEVTKQVGYNLDQEFKRHRAQLNALNREFALKYKFDIASYAVAGCITVTAAMFQPLAYLAGLLGSAFSLTKTLSDVLESRRKTDELRRKPVALLFEAYEDRDTQAHPNQLPEF